LWGADLNGADLNGADLHNADLRSADLYNADLHRADLRGADLRRADLHRADLWGADLRGANLRGADLYCANLNGADLNGADLRGADLNGANLNGAKIDAVSLLRTSIVPQCGQFTGWKKCRDGVIVRLVVGKNARRSNATGRKCRAEYVKVVEVINGTVGVSLHDGITKYEVGKIVRCDTWNEDRWTECGGGIHFYLTREEAEAHQ
jgi:hypothetical protein